MARIKRSRPAKHRVVVDTNILWYKEKSEVVNPTFDQFWDEHVATFDMELVLPEVVRGELLFQQTSSALKVLGRANDSFKELTSIGGSPYTHRVSEARVLRDVEQRLDRWIKRRKAKVQPVPVTEINWPVLITAAIWRKEPFTADPKNPEVEKGFRDALILETVMAIARNAGSSHNTAFLCNDFLLRTAAERGMRTHAGCSCYESIGDFASYLRLTQEKLTEAFVKAIRSRARKKFYSPDDPNCLYYAESLVARIKNDFAAEFDKLGSDQRLLSTGILSNSLFGITSQPPNPWAPAGTQQIWLHSSRFERLEGQRVYHWKAGISFVRLYHRATTTSIITGIENSGERLHDLQFAILWKADVKADGRFHGTTLEGIELESNTFAAATPDELKRYGLMPEAEDQSGSVP
jgi:hypothetical protein